MEETAPGIRCCRFGDGMRTLLVISSIFIRSHNVIRWEGGREMYKEFEEWQQFLQEPQELVIEWAGCFEECSVCCRQSMGENGRKPQNT